MHDMVPKRVDTLLISITGLVFRRLHPPGIVERQGVSSRR
jgi:hypothetical protein